MVTPDPPTEVVSQSRASAVTGPARKEGGPREVGWVGWGADPRPRREAREMSGRRDVSTSLPPGRHGPLRCDQEAFHQEAKAQNPEVPPRTPWGLTDEWKMSSRVPECPRTRTWAGRPSSLGGVTWPDVTAVVTETKGGPGGQRPSHSARHPGPGRWGAAGSSGPGITHYPPWGHCSRPPPLPEGLPSMT